MDLKGKNVIITGGSRGIGKATAEHLSAAGANLFIVARDRGGKERCLIVPDFTLKTAYYLRGLRILLINGAWDQLPPLANEQQTPRRGEQSSDRSTLAYEPARDYD
jgi:hypothetical protein